MKNPEAGSEGEWKEEEAGDQILELWGWKEE